MNLKKLGALSIGAIIVGVLVLAGTASAADMEWDGTGTGTIYHGGVQIHPFAYWHMDFYIDSDTYYIVRGTWIDTLSDHTGTISGYVNRSTGAASGNWGIDNTVPPYTSGIWSGTFNYSTETCSGTWNCPIGNGTWTGSQTYP